VAFYLGRLRIESSDSEPIQDAPCCIIHFPKTPFKKDRAAGLRLARLERYSALFFWDSCASSFFPLPRQTFVSLASDFFKQNVQFTEGLPFFGAGLRSDSVNHLAFKFFETLTLPNAIAEGDEKILQCNVTS